MTRHRTADPPDNAGRPVPLVTVPEGTSEPAQWSTDARGPLQPPAGEDDLVLEERQETEQRERRRRAGGDVDEPPAGRTRESSYSTEREQGAAQPRPAPEEDL